MKRDKLVAIFFVFIFCFATFSHLSSCPNGCPHCWQKFNKSLATIILPVEKADRNTYMISLENLKAEIEKARIGDKLIVELKLGNGKPINIGSFTPQIVTRSTQILEKYNSMGKVSCLLPKDLKMMPATGRLIIRDVSGKFKSSKLVQLKFTP